MRHKPQFERLAHVLGLDERKIFVNPAQKGFRYGVFDIETSGLNAKAFKFCGVYLDGAYQCFRHPSEFWAWVAEQETLVLYAFNIEYDLSGMVDNLLFDLQDVIMNGSRFISAKCGNVTFADSSNLFATLGDRKKLANLAQKFGLRKPDMPASLETDSTDITEDEIEYNRGELVTHHGMLGVFFEFMGGYNLEAKPLTLAGNALHMWQQNFCPDALKEESRNGHVVRISMLDDAFRDSYYGGRTEVFQRGRHQNVVGFDVHSMYPSVMLEGLYPHPGELCYREARQLGSADWAKILDKAEGMAYGWATVPDHAYYGFVPIFRDEDQEKFIFPKGQFWTALCFPEIRALLRYGGHFKMHTTIYSWQTVRPFAKYVEHFYGVRQQTDNEAWRYLVKIFLNSTYGKFGQDGLDQRVYRRTKGDAPGDEPPWAWNPYNSERLQDEGYWEQLNDLPCSYQTILCFAAYTTSMARVKMLDGLVAGQGIYCDTDSVFPAPGHTMPSALIHASDIGMWGVDKEARWAEFWTPKTYALRLTDGTHVLKCKGIPSSMAPALFRNFRAGLRGRQCKICGDFHRGKACVEFSRLVKSAEAARRELPAQSPIDVVKQVSFTDNKRVWENNLLSFPHKYDNNGGTKNVHLCCGGA